MERMGVIVCQTRCGAGSVCYDHFNSGRRPSMVSRKMKSLSLLAGFFMLCATALLGAGIDGKWEGEVKTPDGSAIPISMNFKSDGDKVTGTVTGPAGDVTINDGKLD